MKKSLLALKYREFAESKGCPVLCGLFYFENACSGDGVMPWSSFCPTDQIFYPNRRIRKTDCILKDELLGEGLSFRPLQSFTGLPGKQPRESVSLPAYDSLRSFLFQEAAQ